MLDPELDPNTLRIAMNAEAVCDNLSAADLKALVFIAAQHLCGQASGRGNGLARSSEDVKRLRRTVQPLLALADSDSSRLLLLSELARRAYRTGVAAPAVL